MRAMIVRIQTINKPRDASKGPQALRFSFRRRRRVRRRGAAESRFLYQFLAVKCAVLAYRVGTAILQEIDATHRKTALAGFRWQSIDFVDALNAGDDRPHFFVPKFRRQNSGGGSSSIRASS
jgi:hypothetical protein